MSSINRFSDLNKLCTKLCKVVSFFATQSLIFFILPQTNFRVHCLLLIYRKLSGGPKIERRFKVENVPLHNEHLNIRLMGLVLGNVGKGSFFQFFLTRLTVCY